MVKNIVKIIIISILAVLFFKACVHKDIPEAEIKQSQEESLKLIQPKYPGDFKTVEKNGVEYKVARGEAGISGGTLYTSTIGEGPKTFNPWTAKDATSSNIGELMFDGLVNTDAYTGQIIPQLAKYIKISSSGKEYIIKLRKGIKWSDGQPITSDDVVFTWNDIVIAGYGNTSMLDNVLINGQPPRVEALDKYTVKFTTPEPFAPFLRQLSLSIAPKHILEPVVKQGKKAFDSYWGVTSKPDEFVTSGMFKLSRYIPAQRVELVRNNNYYSIDKTGKQLPYLDKYIMYIVGDQNNEVLKFESGEIDILGVSGKNVTRFKALEKRSDYILYNLGPDTGTMFLSFNQNTRKDDNGKSYVNPIKQKWFNDVNFRKAVDYAIDREGIVSNVLEGVGSPLFTAESLSSIYLNHKLKAGHPRDLKIAKDYLKKSGFKWDMKGKLFDKWNNRVEFTLYTNAGNTERESTGVMIKQDLEELGIKVNFKPIEFNVLVGKLVNSLDWDAIIISLTGSPLEPHSGRNVWSSTGSLHLFNQRTGKYLVQTYDIKPWEKEIDDLFEEGARTIDFEKRHEIYNKYQDIIYNELPLHYLYSSLRIYAARKKIGNLHPTPLGGVTHNLEELYIKR
jgi:peptide/nickel transport system substrate-binding protein